jgi:hypothetical protein
VVVVVVVGGGSGVVTVGVVSVADVSVLQVSTAAGSFEHDDCGAAAPRGATRAAAAIPARARRRAARRRPPVRRTANHDRWTFGNPPALSDFSHIRGFPNYT